MDFFSSTILFQQSIYPGKLCFRKIDDPLPKFFIKLFFYPGHLFSLFPYTCFGSGKADLQWIIQVFVFRISISF